MDLEEDNSAGTSATMSGAKKRKLPLCTISPDPGYVAPKRFSIFDNALKLRKEEWRNIMKITAKKLKAIDKPVHFLRRSILVNNLYRHLRKEMLDEKRHGYNNCYTPISQHETSGIVGGLTRPNSPVCKSRDNNCDLEANVHSTCNAGLPNTMPDVNIQQGVTVSPQNVKDALQDVNDMRILKQCKSMDEDSDMLDTDSCSSGRDLDAVNSILHRYSSCVDIHNAVVSCQMNDTLPDNDQHIDEKYSIKNASHQHDNATPSNDEHSQTCCMDTGFNSSDSHSDDSSTSEKISERDRQILSGIDEIFNMLYSVLSEVDSDLDKHSAMVTEVQVC